MKRNLIRVVSLAALMTACSNDEIIDVKQEPITFNVTTENVTRADSISTISNLSKFALYADYTIDNKTTSYLNADTLRASGSSWIMDGGNSYWPASGTLSFYAIANNDKGSYSKADDGTRTVNLTVAEKVNKQKDLLYAVTANQSKPDNTNNTAVNLNFRHALSQIAFQAKNLNQHLKITISEVMLGNVYGTGTLTLPTNSTTASVPDTSDGTVGTWSFASGATTSASYSFEVSAELKGNSETATDLSAKTVNSKAVDDNYMLLIPQKTTKWDAKSTITETTTTGSYLALKCKIENYVSDDVSSVTLWPSSGTASQAYIYIPVDFDWLAGHKYVYTFIFGSTTNGGYDGNGKSVLTPITYSVSVNGFTTGSEDVEMKEVVTE